MSVPVLQAVSEWDDGYPRRNGLAGGRNGNAETRCDHLLDLILVAAAMTGAPLTVRGKR
jgi:hypothetical protein